MADYTDPNQNTLDSGLGMVKQMLARIGLGFTLTPRVFLHPTTGEIAITLTHCMHKPMLNESFADTCGEIESDILDSDLFEELRASLDSELYQAKQQSKSLMEEIIRLRKYENWYDLEQSLLNTAAEEVS